MIPVIRSVNGGDVCARRGRPWLDFVESEKESEMSERAKSQKKEHSETNVCLPMTLREMLG